MSESISEMILPSTYIEVRSEGLIGVGSIATGNIGVVGTAARGKRNEVVSLGSYADAVEAFGAYDAFASPRVAGSPLTLVRALELAFMGGASSVYAVRIANGDPAKATLAIKADGAPNGFTLTAKDPGTYGNEIMCSVVLDTGAPAETYKLTLSYLNVQEAFVGTTTGAIRDLIAGESKLVDVDAGANLAVRPATVDPAAPLTGGNDQASVTAVDLAAGLAALVDQPVNIVLAGGFGSAAARGAVGAHLEATENQGRERVAVLGGTNSTAATMLTEAKLISDDRIILVGPGLKATDAAAKKPVVLPPPYLAAVVAGTLSTLAPHISLTNKTLPVEDLDIVYSTTVYKNLLMERTLLVRPKFGFQVVKGITTDTGAFKQISVRRIVDNAKAGVRLGADPYIGKLNNVRVRAALKATLDGFLSQMVLDEKLVEYELSVSATRSQEINGIAAVVITMKPTFSIDYIRVTMTLQ